MTEICRKCAACCKNHPFVDLSHTEVHSLECLTGLHPDAFTNQKMNETVEYFLQFQENGDCFFLHEDAGNFSCDVYEARPEICRNYPTALLQQETCSTHSEKFLPPAGS